VSDKKREPTWKNNNNKKGLRALVRVVLNVYGNSEECCRMKAVGARPQK
jgi:hypothetical protein